MHAVWLDFECRRSEVEQMTRMLWVSGYVVEVSTLVVAGTRHSTADCGRCARHWGRYLRSTWRLVPGTQRRVVPVSSLQLHSLRCLLVTDDHPRSRQQTGRYEHRVARRRRHHLAQYVHRSDSQSCRYNTMLVSLCDSLAPIWEYETPPGICPRVFDLWQWTCYICFTVCCVVWPYAVSNR